MYIICALMTSYQLWLLLHKWMEKILSNWWWFTGIVLYTKPELPNFVGLSSWQRGTADPRRSLISTKSGQTNDPRVLSVVPEMYKSVQQTYHSFLQIQIWEKPRVGEACLHQKCSFFLTLFKGEDPTHVIKFCCKYSVILKGFLAT